MEKCAHEVQKYVHESDTDADLDGKYLFFISLVANTNFNHWTD